MVTNDVTSNLCPCTVLIEGKIPTNFWLFTTIDKLNHNTIAQLLCNSCTTISNGILGAQCWHCRLQLLTGLLENNPDNYTHRIGYQFWNTLISWLSFGNYRHKQEFTPVGCVASATVVALGMCLPGGVSAREGWGCLPGGGGGSARGVHLAPWTKW